MPRPTVTVYLLVVIVTSGLFLVATGFQSPCPGLVTSRNTINMNNNHQHNSRQRMGPLHQKRTLVLNLSSTPPPSTDDDQEKGLISADGTFYDDEVDSAPVKTGISDSMKARLMAEASTGLDSNKAQTNVLLYIILAVAVLVVLGGAGIFY